MNIKIDNISVDLTTRLSAKYQSSEDEPDNLISNSNSSFLQIQKTDTFLSNGKKFFHHYKY